jgi:hypothetical protein
MQLTDETKRRSSLALLAALILSILLVDTAHAEQKAYTYNDTIGSSVIINVSVSTPISPCLIYSTSGQDALDNVFIQAGLYDCAPGWVLDSSACSAGRYEFGETAGAGVYSCSRGRTWALNTAIAAKVSYTGTGTDWTAYVGGIYRATKTGFYRTTNALTWTEFNSGNSTCPSGLHTNAHIYGWNVRPNGTASYISPSNPTSYNSGPSLCLTKSAYSSGFTVSR